MSDERISLDEYEQNSTTSYPRHILPDEIEKYINLIERKFHLLRAEIFKFSGSHNIPDVLWHYTTTEGFFKIIENNCLLLSDVSNLNDPLEGQMIKREIGAGLNPESNLDVERVFDPYWGVDPKYRPRLQKLDQTVMTRDRSFVFSLSESEDSLDQWRIYGDDAQGICIGFDGPKLFIDSNAERKYHFNKINYDPKQREAVIHILISDFDTCHKLVDDAGFKKDSRAYKSLINQVYLGFKKLLEHLKLTFKHECYKSEEEWRVFSNILVAGMDTEFVYLPKRNEISERLVLSGELFDGGYLPIKEIVCGNRHNMQQTRRFIRDRFQDRGPVAVSHSDLPYRGK